MTTYLYRAVTTTPIEVYIDGEKSTEPAGMTIGRKTGYLSRSAAVAAARRALFDPDEFEIVRSEPVIFLTKRERIEREIARLRAELDGGAA